LKSSLTLFVRNNIRTKVIKILLNLGNFDVNLFEGYDFVKSAGLYGSYAKGGNTEDSDIDLWILTGETGEEDLRHHFNVQCWFKPRLRYFERLFSPHVMEHHPDRHCRRRVQSSSLRGNGPIIHITNIDLNKPRHRDGTPRLRIR